MTGVQTCALPISARVMTAAGNIAEALGIAIAVADAEIEAETQG